MNRLDKKLRSLCIEPPSASFSSRGKEWILERDRIGNIIAKTDEQITLIVDEEFVNMNIEDLTLLLESGGL